MSVVFLVLPLALIIVAGAVVAFVWSARSGQFDDLDTPAIRVLHDESTRTTSRKPAPVPPKDHPGG